MSVIQGIYIALFGRPADPGGLAYWNGVTNNGADLSEMLRVLPSLDEYTARFAGQTEDQVITTIYQSLFGRDPEPAGLAFFKAQLASGAQNMATIAVNIFQGAQGDDKADVQAKVDAAVLFTTSLDTPEEIEAYKGDAANALARDFLSKVNKDAPATAASVEQAVNGVVNPSEGQGPGGGGGGGGGTTDPEPVNPNDTRIISADDLVGDEPASWDAGDGVDTLIVDFTGSSVLPHQLNLSGIENFEVLVIKRDDITVPQHSPGAYTIKDLPASIRMLVLEGDLKLGGSVTIEHPTLETFVIAGDVVGTGVGPTYGNLSFNSGDVALENLTIVTNGTVDGVRIAGVENLTLNATGNVGDTAAVRLDGVKTLMLNGGEFALNLLDGKLEELTGNAAKVKLTNVGSVVDAADFAGNLTIVGGSLDNTLTTGAGNDIIWGDDPKSGAVQASKYGNDVIDAGAGSNVVVLGTANQNILAGGADTVVIDGTKAGTTAVFNFNFGPVGEDRSVGGTPDKVFDVIDFRNVAREDIKVSIGNSNAAYLDVVAAATGRDAVTTGNLIDIDGTNVYAGPATGSEFELVIEAGAHKLVFSNALSVFEKLALVAGLPGTEAALTQVAPLLLVNWDGKTYAEKMQARAQAEPILHQALATSLGVSVEKLTAELVDVTAQAGNFVSGLIGQGNFKFDGAIID